MSPSAAAVCAFYFVVDDVWGKLKEGSVEQVLLPHGYIRMEHVRTKVVMPP